MEPLLLEPIYKDYLWGGTKLKTDFNKQSDINPIAESWECSVHADGPSIIRNGIYAGRELRELIQKSPEIVGTKHNGKLPILVKFIDSEKDLSVQVHPDDEYAIKHENDNGKTEMWYVVAAEPNAEIVVGFEHDMTDDMLREAIKAGRLNEHLKRIKVYPGNSFLIEPGTVHAIGAGCTIVEVQQNSNVTYRLYDYNRRDKQGNLRERHIDKALDVLNMNKASTDCLVIRDNVYESDYSTEAILQHRLFTVNKININSEWQVDVDKTTFRVLVVLGGNGSIGNNLIIKKGDTIFLPAGSGIHRLKGKMEILAIEC